MKNKVGYYFDLTSAEKASVWDSGYFIFDTNVLLKLYLLTDKARGKIFDAMNVFNSRIWMPHHIAYEFATNRYLKINESRKRYTNEFNNIENLFNEMQTKLNLQNDNPELDKIHEDLKAWLTNHQKTNLPFESYSNDPLADKILEIFDGKIGDEFTTEELSELKVEGEMRFKAKIPPGYKDYDKIKCKSDTDKELYSENNFLGDLIIWKQILNFALSTNKDIILITEDEKEDWWYNVSGEKIGARLELRREFTQKTHQRFLIYNISGFLHYFNEYIEKQHPGIEQIPDSILKEVSVSEQRTLKDDISIYRTRYSPISTEQFIGELNSALEFFSQFGGFLSSKHFVETILAEKGYDIGLCWEKVKELERNNTIEQYTHDSGDGRYPLGAIRFRKQ
ncbi:hypothetical protein HMPREF1141_1952 [Clostridium sp. MSTE9]|uniref:PIN-like domain-containing protein n=1 Tax=Clostridium sp. (strain MSTE9) TaxID=1105031 RepID=UPI00026F4163|nr:PIN-like domain-containing protein [Clostridium sp. MSTE9]EJF39671.1 hypothetical protein HMPREF1141_1952 [Clostridium sp. MSTE9]